MLKRYFFLVFLITCFCSLKVDAQSQGQPVANPQLQMFSARFMSLGGANPVIDGDIGGMFINPAVVGSNTPMPLSVSHQQLMGFFDCELINFSFPFELMIPMNDRIFSQKLIFGFAYGTNILRDISESIKYQDQAFAVGTYSAGFDIFQGVAATEFYDALGFDKLSGGIGFKLLRQFIASDERSSFGIDTGLIGTYNLGQYHIDKLHLGVSVLNIMATPLIWNSGPAKGAEAYLPFQPFIGARIDVLDEELSLYTHNAVDNIAVGAEWYLHENFCLRGSTNFQDISFGTGLIFESVAGFGEQNYGIRFDYNYTNNIDPLGNNPDNTFSISILGESRERTPEIIVPAQTVMTNNKTIMLKGAGSRQSTIRIYNNGDLVRTTSTDRYGRWLFNSFLLSEGKNVITIKSYSIKRDVSIESDKRVVWLDTTPPDVEVSIVPAGDDKIKVIAQTPSDDILEAMREVEGLSGDDRFAFNSKNDYYWEAVVTMSAYLRSGSPVPDKMDNIMIYAVDNVGNNTGILNYNFYIAMNYPKDKHVNYRRYVRCIGESSSMVKSIFLDDKQVYIDDYYKFSVTKELKGGKNLLKFYVTTLNDQVITYKMRILRLVTFPDLTKDIKERREIEFLATLGLLDAEEDGNFYPDEFVTRGFLTKMMVKAADIDMPDKIQENLFSDVSRDDPLAPYVMAAVNEGLMFAYPDSTFKPDKPLTLSEALYLLSNAGIIEEEGFPSDTKYARRKELAQYLAYTPRYEIKIERLIDWEKGYE
ncbi:MAG: S-layer homology domain-containing protein [bacterium]|nr:S-layer homology domain-containing protein [bacterium]